MAKSARSTMAENFGVSEARLEMPRLLGDAAAECLTRGEIEAAQVIYEGLAALMPRDPCGPLGLAEAALAAGRPRDAERLARQAQQLPNCTADTLATALAIEIQAVREARRGCDGARPLERLGNLRTSALAIQLHAELSASPSPSPSVDTPAGSPVRGEAS